MNRTRLTPERVRRFACAEGQAFLFDTDVPRLAVRATVGSKSYVFEGYLNRRTIRMTIGDAGAWALDDARKEARRLQTLIDQGTDPREAKAAQREAASARIHHPLARSRLPGGYPRVEQAHRADEIEAEAHAFEECQDQQHPGGACQGVAAKGKRHHAIG